MRKFDLSLRSSRSSYFATFRHQLTILSKTDASDEEKWLNMLGTFVKDWFRYNLLKFMRASIKMIGVSNLQSFIASMTQKLTLSDISDESKNYLDKAGITTACLRIKSKWTAGGK